MPLADNIKGILGSQSMIRRMFEEGIELKKLHGEENVFDFSLGNPDIEPPPAFRRLLLEFANDEKKGTHAYMPNAGFPFVREAIAKKVSLEQKIDIDGSGIVMSCGAAGALNVIFKSIINPGDEVIVTKPYFMEYRFYISNYGGIIKEIDSLEDFSLDTEAVRKNLSHKTAALIINSPHNPTGRIYSEESLIKLAGILEEHGKKCGRKPYLISDEPYRELSYDGTPVSPVLPLYSESLVVASFSKSLSLPGERIGFIAVNPCIEERENLVSAFIFSTRVLGFVNAPAMMQRMAAELILEKVDINIYHERRAAFTKILDNAGIFYAKPEGAFYLFCRVPRGKNGNQSDIDFAEHLKNNLILGVPGSGFAMPGWIRFAYCVDKEKISLSKKTFEKAMAEW